MPIASLWFLAAPAVAEDLVVLHDNGEPDLVNGYSNQTAGVFGFRRTLLDDFVVPEHFAWSIEKLHWYHVWDDSFAYGMDLEVVLRHDDAGVPGPVFAQPVVTDYFEMGTGRVIFSREERESWAVFEPIILPAGRYWFEAAIIGSFGTTSGTQTNFWLTASPVRHSECWVNYEDLGGFQSGTDQFGVASDLAWSLEGAVQPPGIGACCLADGQCFEMDFNACNDAGGLYQGPDVNCFPALCGSPNACCFTDGTCRYETDVFCAALGGHFAGLGTNCGSFQCVGSGFCFVPGDDFFMGNETAAMALVDLDGQSGPDAVTARFTLNSLTVRGNDGTGVFPAGAEYPTGLGPVSIAVGDLDGDLDADVVVAAGTDGAVAVHLNDGTGTIAPPVAYPAGSAPVDVEIGDLDGDLDPDLAVTDGAGNRVLILRNDGAGVFGPFVDYAVDEPDSVAIADLDGDLDPDLAVTNRATDTVSVLINDGAGTFAAPALHATTAGPGDLLAHDLDGDGDVDLAVVGSVDDEVSIHMNNGDGTFAADVRYAVGGGPTAITIVGALDEETPDLAVATGGVDNVSVLINNGAGSFDGQRTYAAEGDGIGLDAADLDGDLDIDLVVANVSHIATFFNDCSGCPGDLDASGAVDFGDILRILGAWGMSGGPEDLDGSGFVDFGDLLFVLGAWGVCG